jgi:hypothetical protein
LVTNSALPRIDAGASTQAHRRRRIDAGASAMTDASARPLGTSMAAFRTVDLIGAAIGRARRGGETTPEASARTEA